MKRSAFLRLALAALAALADDRRVGAGLSQPAGARDHSVPARRHARHARPRARAEARRPDRARPFVVENRPGGNGIIGADAVAKAPADGYTLLFNASTFVTAPMTMKQVPYAIEKDFTPIALVAKAPLSVAIAKDLPVTDIKSLIAYAKANGDKTTFAVGSIGSAGHLATELLKRAGGIELHGRPVQGHGAGVPGPARRPHRRLHRSDPRLAAVPQGGPAARHRRDVRARARRTCPTCRPSPRRIPGYEFYSWYGLWGPAKLPDDIRAQAQRRGEQGARLRRHARQVHRRRACCSRPAPVDDFVNFQRDDMAQSQKIITEGNIRVE